MSGSNWDAEYWFFGGVDNAGSYTGALLMGGGAGPMRVTVDWGSGGPNGVDPRVETYEPEASGEFYFPSSNGVRLYSDGTYTLRVSADFDGAPNDLEIMHLFVDLNGTDAVRRAGNGRDDLMAGGSGADSFYGNGGDDMLLGGFGDDRLSGGDGNDTLDGAGTGGGDGADSLYGAGGDDKMFGRDGNDYLNGGIGNDEMEGGAGGDTLYGDAGEDDLEGNDGNDRLSGGDGADRFEGGAGIDTLASTVDGDSDLFVFNSRTLGRDFITGFETGIDKIELSFLSYEKVGPSRLIDSADAMTDDGIYLIYTQSNGNLFLDINGTDTGGRTTIATLTRGTELAHGDFVFGV